MIAIAMMMMTMIKLMIDDDDLFSKQPESLFISDDIQITSERESSQESTEKKSAKNITHDRRL